MSTDNLYTELENLKIDTNSTVSYCDDLIANSINLESVNQSIKYIVGTDIPTYFSGDTADIQSISAGLTKNVEFLDNLIKFNKEFAMTLQDYAVSIANISEGGKGSTSGDGGHAGGGGGRL